MENKQLSAVEKVSLWLPLLLSAALAIGLWIGFKLSDTARPVFSAGTGNLPQGMDGQGGKVEEILRFIDARYLETAEMSKLEDAAIEGLLQELDPHSNYIPGSEIEGVNEALSGGFEGIGVEFFILEDTVFVVGVVPQGPSAKAGVEVGDKIIMVNDSLLAGQKITNKQVIEKLKGAANSPVTLQVQRGQSPDLLKIDLRRGQIPIRSVDVAYMINPQTGYIKINRFSDKTYKEFMEATEKMLVQDKIQNLIIDLRHNPGGYLTAATEILNQLFEAKKMLVYTEGRSYKRKEYHSTGNAFFKIGKIAVLIDEGSASASEILAGAIQDNDRGIVVGRRSFGKGLVQEQYELSDGSALRLTVAKYYTPSGRLIQKPYQKGDLEKYDDDLMNRYASGELYSKDSVKLNDSVKYYTTGGRIVYGGGGIMPDVFVPMDTFMRNREFAGMNGYVPQFVYKYMDIERPNLKTQFADIEQFAQKFAVSDALFNAFIAYANSKGSKADPALIQQTKKFVSDYIRAYIAQQLFGDAAFFKILHQSDKMLKQALVELK
jgi:carboxyl-terminal processing protease